jgi:hypothetical protein
VHDGQAGDEPGPKTAPHGGFHQVVPFLGLSLHLAFGLVETKSLRCLLRM